MPETLTLHKAMPDSPGRLEILYTDGADLMRQLAEFLSVAGVNREEYFAATEPSDDAHPGSPGSLPSVQFQEFEGPIDLLLDEVRRQNVEIEKIAMAPIVARFLEYVGKASERNLNLDIDWLHMAATLIHWKSRSLLPSEPGGRGAIRTRSVTAWCSSSLLTVSRLPGNSGAARRWPRAGFHGRPKGHLGRQANPKNRRLSAFGT